MFSLENHNYIVSNQVTNCLASSYFTGYKERGVVGALYYSRLINGQYEEPIKLRDDMNQGEYIAGSMIAPDESYLIWSV